MNTIEQVEGLIQRLPKIACTTNSPAAFWQRVDGTMEVVRACAKSEPERTEIEVRYGDLVEMANRLGVPDRDFARATKMGQLPQLSTVFANRYG